MDRNKRELPREQDESRKRKRKPYEPPRVLEVASFEGLALGCGQYSFRCGPSQFSPS